MTQYPTSTPPGWYPDPEDASRVRYFNGSQWTEQTRPMPAPKPPLYKRGWFWAAVAFVLVISGFSGHGTSDKQTGTSTTIAPVPSSTFVPRVTRTPTPSSTRVNTPSPTRVNTPSPTPTPEPQWVAATTEPEPAPPEPEPEPVQQPEPPAPPPPAPNVYFANCSEARAAGAAPMRQGDPGYRSQLDRDHDGIACE